MINGFPNIPNLSPTVRAGVDAAISFGGAAAIRAVFSDQWGVYSQFGVPVLLADTVESVSFINSSDLASAPVERGSFTSYNKVQNPYDATVRMTRGGASPLLRGAFIAQIEAISRSTLLYHVVTPDYVHRNANVTGFSYRREAQQGARMISAEIILKEVRQSTVRMSDIEQVANPSDASSVGAGQVEPRAPQRSLLDRISQPILDAVGNSNSWGNYFGG